MDAIPWSRFLAGEGMAVPVEASFAVLVWKDFGFVALYRKFSDVECLWCFRASGHGPATREGNEAAQPEAQIFSMHNLLRRRMVCRKLDIG